VRSALQEVSREWRCVNGRDGAGWGK
jgi:hypothetical protein